MDFDIGDELVYYPSIDNLAPALYRTRDWGYIADISNGYIHFKFYDSSVHKILPFALKHSPHSPKYFRNIFAEVILNINSAAISKKLQMYKNNYSRTLHELVQQVIKKQCLDVTWIPNMLTNVKY